ncbi:MAG: N-6 DNA methylase, partial [Zoogloeaceae bacterium]|nr:N-6 DNA methylase [Zoogloeaceae bacterium]
MSNQATALQQFARSLHEKFSVHVAGEPEDQLRAPFEQLLAVAGQELGFQKVVPIGETALMTIGRPDYGVACNKLLCGHVELKAPGKGADTAKFKGHDKAQWERFKNLPNILYSDGQAFALYRIGKPVRGFSLPRDPCALGAAAVDAESARQFNALLTDFLSWEPIVPGNAKQLVEYLAPLCRNLRDDVLDALKNGIPAVHSAANDWRRYLFPGADDAHFADAYAQTVTFTLLLARSNGSDTLFLDQAIASLTHANRLLSRALQALTDPLVKEHLGASLDVLLRVISRVPSGTMSGGRRDPWLNFYEDFLAEYDPELRRSAGVYYTPVEVVKAQVCLVDELLRNKLGKPLGFAAGSVNVLDPAVGTGTYLLGIIEHALETVRQKEGEGVLPARATLLGARLYGLEIMVGPYAVASLRLTRMVQQYGGELPGDGVQIMLNNTLESPREKIPELPLLYQPIGLEHRRAKRVKEAVPVLVCIGNPPYGRHAAADKENLAMTGGWVRWGELKDGRDAILDDFIEPVKRAGKGNSLKNLYNLYVYFWRFALWKTFEHDLANGHGVVSFITASSFIDGDAFLGMRAHMRRLCDEIWVIDLGGEGRGTHQDDNVFAIQTPVAITIAVRYGGPRPETAAKVHYTRIEGSRAEKLAKLESLHSLANLNFKSCSEKWDAPFRPAGKGGYFNWPLLTDLMPWQHSGTQAKRTWPIGATQDVLEKRWRQLLTASDRASAFKESRDRKITTSVTALRSANKLKPIAELAHNAPPENPVRYGFRSFDRQFLLADNRVCDYLRPELWRAHSSKQLYFASLFTQTLEHGPALTVSAEVPDLHFFRGSFGAKDIVPLYRDAAAKDANLHPQLLAKLSTAYGQIFAPEDFADYLYCILAQPAFTDRFAEELESRKLRLPLT